MIRCYVKVILFFLAVAGIAPTTAAPVPPQTAGQSTRSSVAARVYEILDVPAEGPSYLPQLATLIAAPVQDRDAVEARVDELVTAVLAGSQPGEFSRVLTDAVSILSKTIYPNDEEWKYGTPLDRVALVRLLWGKAQVLDEAPEARAAYAKAALLLAANEDFLNGESMMARIWRDVDQYAAIAKLTPDQAARIRALQSSINATVTAYGKASMEVIYAEAAILKALKAPDAPIPPDALMQELDALERGWQALKDGPGLSLGNRFYLIIPAWHLRSLAHQRQDIAAEQLINKLIRSWRDEKWPDPVDRWLNEALTNYGPVPTRPRIIGPGAPKD